MKVLSAVLCLCLLGLAGTASSQSLAELAAKEKEKRKGQKPVKTYTDSDLGSAGRGTLSVTGEAAPAEAEKPADGKTEKTDREKREEKRLELQKQVEALVQQKAPIQKRMDDAQRELNDMTNYAFGPRRAALIKIVEEGPAELAKIDQAIADIEDQARRLGVSISR